MAHWMDAIAYEKSLTDFCCQILMSQCSVYKWASTVPKPMTSYRMDAFFERVITMSVHQLPPSATTDACNPSAQNHLCSFSHASDAWDLFPPPLCILILNKSCFPTGKTPLPIFFLFGFVFLLGQIRKFILNGCDGGFPQIKTEWLWTSVLGKQKRGWQWMACILGRNFAGWCWHCRWVNHWKCFIWRQILSDEVPAYKPWDNQTRELLEKAIRKSHW